MSSAALRAAAAAAAAFFFGGLDGGFLLRVLGCLFLGVLSGLFLGLVLGALLGYVSLLLLFGGLGLGSFLGFIGLFRLGGFLGLGLSSLVSLLLFRRFRSSDLLLFQLLLLEFLLLELLLFELLDFVLLGGGLLRLASDLLVGLCRRLALRLELVERGLHDRLGGGSSGANAQLTNSMAKIRTCRTTARTTGQK